MKNEQEIKDAICQYGDMVYRLGILYLKNHYDAEDIHQDTFLKYATYDKPFDSCEHEKAWLIRVTINLCKDKLKRVFRKYEISWDKLNFEPAMSLTESKNILSALLELPPKYRLVVYMICYEGYTAAETAKILKRNENTIYSWLRRGKEKLKDSLGGDILE